MPSLSRFVSATLLVLGAGFPARGETAPQSQPADTQPAAPATRPAIDPGEAKRLLSGLGSDDARTRQRSQDQLVRLGEAARPSLNQLLKQTTDLEVITRAQSALRQIDDDRVFGPSYITLHLKDAEAKEAVAELSRQAFAPLSVFPDNLLDAGGLPKVNLQADREPFWKVMQQLSEQTGLDLQPFNEGVRLMRGGMRMNGPSVIRGPFLIVANQIMRTQVIQLGAAGAAAGGQSDFRLNLCAYAEPKMKVVRCAPGVKLDEAVDDKGNSLLLSGPRREAFVSAGGTGVWQLFAQFAWPDKPGSRIARLKGSASFTVQTKSRIVEIHDLPSVKDKSEVIAGTALTVHSFTRANDGWELKLSITVDPANPLGMFQAQQAILSDMRVVDAQGVALERRGATTRQTNNEMELILALASSVMPGRQAGPPVKLLWEFPIETKEITVPFEFQNLPMPSN